MSFFDKMMFWKKDDFDDLGKDFNFDKPPMNDVGTNFNMDEISKPPIDNGFSTPSGLSLERNDGFGGSRPGGMQNNNFGGMNNNFQQSQPQNMQQNNGAGSSRDMELISAKLDAIKAMLENVNQRLINIENLANAEQKKDEVRW